MKRDLKKELDGYRVTRGRFRIVDIPTATYLTLPGRGDPNSSADYADGVSALFSLGYRIKFASRSSLDRDYVVMPLEAQWRADDPALFTSARDKTSWEWTLLMMVPSWISAIDLRSAVEALDAATPAQRRVRLRPQTEGLCVQTLHVGPFDEEADTLRELHERFIPDHGLRMTGDHHEIYLSDARRTHPSRLRTILRQPVERR